MKEFLIFNEAKLLAYLKLFQERIFQEKNVNLISALF